MDVPAATVGPTLPAPVQPPSAPAADPAAVATATAAAPPSPTAGPIPVHATHRKLAAIERRFQSAK